MRQRRVAVAVAALGLVVAGCAGGTGDDDEAEISKPTEEIDQIDGTGKTLDLWIMEGTNPDAKPFFDDLSADFQEETGAELNVQFVPWADAHDKFVKSIAGGTTPDVAEVGTTWTPEFADAGALVDLTDAVSRPVSTATWSPGCRRPAPSTAACTACRGTPASARSSTAPTSSRRPASSRPPPGTSSSRWATRSRPPTPTW